MNFLRKFNLKFVHLFYAQRVCAFLSPSSLVIVYHVPARCTYVFCVSVKLKEFHFKLCLRRHQPHAFSTLPRSLRYSFVRNVVGISSSQPIRSLIVFPLFCARIIELFFFAGAKDDYIVFILSVSCVCLYICSFEIDERRTSGME